MDYKKYNDNELIYMVHENDEDSTNLLIEKYYPIIFNLSREYYSKYEDSGYELDDFYQEALNAFYKAIYTYDSSKGVLFYTFVIVCIRRHLTSFGRKISKNINTIDSIDIGDLEYCLEDINENPNTINSFKGLEKIIKDMIFKLPLDLGSVLELKVNGFTYKEISILLDIPISSVCFRVRRVRNLLRNKINAYYCK